MRVRYQYAGGSSYIAECDLTEKKARKRFKELKQNAICEWVELVAEDEWEGEYMEVIACDDKTETARKIYVIMKEMGVI